MIVEPLNWSGYSASLARLWGSGPKFIITCGNCNLTFSQRIPVIDNPGVKCPHCDAINVIPLLTEKTVNRA